MRETQTIDPMWEGGGNVRPGPRLLGTGARWLGAALKRVAPALVGWASGMGPEVRVAWGARIYHLRRDGLVSVRRTGPGYEDNPRRNYNEAVEKRQAREAAPEVEVAAADSAAADSAAAVVEQATDPSAEPAPLPPEPPTEPTEAPAEAPRVDLSADAMREEVARAMGMTPEPAEGEAAEVGDADAVKEKIVAVRSLLQNLDDVADWDLVEQVDEELYLLHKAVEYKLKNHKASEAKAQLADLFK